MKKRDIVKSKILFNDIIQKGRKTSNKFFVICYVSKDEFNNSFGIAVGTKVGNAVTRNKIKRQVRSIIDNNRESFPNFHNYIIICKKEVLNISYKDMENMLLNLITKGEKNEK